ncbi:MAG: DNA repair protein RecN [Desulfobacterales bacterium]|jgi:DNA repair protein RecN (Recombination protein N)|nr:DNA repair protein RecN [Desulfobacterales bacterium]
MNATLNQLNYPITRMLCELSIKNFAIIDDLTIDFKDGMTVFSGETGAGKSIILNAVNLLLGGRATSRMIRTGAQSAELEAMFYIRKNSGADKALKDQGYEASDELLIRRIISHNDRHRVYINGKLATMQQLTEVTRDLAVIAGQHEHQRLLDESQHLMILDQFGGLLGLREKVDACFHEMIPMIQKLEHLTQCQNKQKEHMELLSFQKKEIRSAGIAPGEDDALKQERLRLKNAEILHQTAWGAAEALYGGDGAIAGKIGDIRKQIEKVAAIDTQLSGSATELSDIAFRLEDVGRNLQSYADGILFDERRLEEIEARLDFLNRLKHKYGQTLADVNQRLIDIETELSTLENLSDAIVEVEGRLAGCRKTFIELCAELSEKRRSAAGTLTRRLESELSLLKMPRTKSDMEFIANTPSKTSSPQLVHDGVLMTETGAEQARFLISPNVGEALKPLSSIASGGELSRVILALKTILSGPDVTTLIFDEVDAGIGGEASEMVGKKLSDLSLRHQVICITHLAQIAKFARHHYKISKQEDQGRTFTRISILNNKDRLEETARMIGGATITQTTRDHAREMLKICQSKTPVKSRARP